MCLSRMAQPRSSRAYGRQTAFGTLAAPPNAMIIDTADDHGPSRPVPAVASLELHQIGDPRHRRDDPMGNTDVARLDSVD